MCRRATSRMRKKHGQTDVCSSRLASIAMAPWESNIRMLTGTIKVDGIQLPVEPYLAAHPALQQGVIAGVFRQKGAAPWDALGRRSCNSQYSSPMICLWRIGMQRCVAYQPFGLRLPCWVLTIFAKLLAVIFTS